MAELPPSPSIPRPNPMIAKRGVQRSIRALNQSSSGLENTLVDFFQLSLKEVLEAFNGDRRVLEKTNQSILEVRDMIAKLFDLTGTTSALANPKKMDFDLYRGPKEPAKVAQRLNTCLTGCRNAILTLLGCQPGLVTAELSKTHLGQIQLERLAMLNQPLKTLTLFTFRDAVNLFNETVSKPTSQPQAIKPSPFRTFPPDLDSLHILSGLWATLDNGKVPSLVFEIGKELILHQEDRLKGEERKVMTFRRLHSLFSEIDHHQLTHYLGLAQNEMAQFGFRIIGFFEMSKNSPLTLEKMKAD